MTGGKSNQNIGLFRCMGGEESEKAVAEYWEYEKRLPYFAVGFLKIREPQKYREVGLNLEAAFNVGADDAGRLCVALTYITFDNADLVILIKGNSMTRMCGLMEATERREEVLYAHFIPGVEEDIWKPVRIREGFWTTGQGHSALQEKRLPESNCRWRPPETGESGRR